MERKEIVELEKDMFRQVTQSVIAPLNRRLDTAFHAKLAALVGCLRGGRAHAPETRECVDRAEAEYRDKVEESGLLLSDLEVSSPGPVQQLHPRMPVRLRPDRA